MQLKNLLECFTAIGVRFMYFLKKPKPTNQKNPRTNIPIPPALTPTGDNNFVCLDRGSFCIAAALDLLFVSAVWGAPLSADW